MLPCLTAWVTGRKGEGHEDRQKSTVEMGSVKDPSLERECLLRTHVSGRASLVHPPWQQQFGSVRVLQCANLSQRTQISATGCK